MTALQQRANPKRGHTCRASCTERMPRSTQSCTRRSTLRRVTESLAGCARTIANMQKSENLWASQAHRSLASMFISDGRLTAVRRAVHRGQTGGSLLLLMLAMLHESRSRPSARPSKASKFRLLAATAAPSGLGFGGALHAEHSGLFACHARHRRSRHRRDGPQRGLASVCIVITEI